LRTKTFLDSNSAKAPSNVALLTSMSLHNCIKSGHTAIRTQAIRQLRQTRADQVKFSRSPQGRCFHSLKGAYAHTRTEGSFCPIKVGLYSLYPHLFRTKHFRHLSCGLVHLKKATNRVLDWWPSCLVTCPVLTSRSSSTLCVLQRHESRVFQATLWITVESSAVTFNFAASGRLATRGPRSFSPQLGGCTK
jgi:hypothetical protein